MDTDQVMETSHTITASHFDDLTAMEILFILNGDPPGCQLILNYHLVPITYLNLKLET